VGHLRLIKGQHWEVAAQDNVAQTDRQSRLFVAVLSHMLGQHFHQSLLNCLLFQSTLFAQIAYVASCWLLKGEQQVPETTFILANFNDISNTLSKEDFGFFLVPVGHQT
jgi:hypothetical protein